VKHYPTYQSYLCFHLSTFSLLSLSEITWIESIFINLVLQKVINTILGLYNIYNGKYIKMWFMVCSISLLFISRVFFEVFVFYRNSKGQQLIAICKVIAILYKIAIRIKIQLWQFCRNWKSWFLSKLNFDKIIEIEFRQFYRNWGLVSFIAIQTTQFHPTTLSQLCPRTLYPLSYALFVNCIKWHILTFRRKRKAIN